MCSQAGLKKTEFPRFHSCLLGIPGILMLLTKPRHVDDFLSRPLPDHMMQLNLQEDKRCVVHSVVTRWSDTCDLWWLFVNYPHTSQMKQLVWHADKITSDQLVSWRLACHSQCGQTAITTFFLAKGRNTPTWQFLQRSDKKQLCFTLKCHYDSPSLTTESRDSKRW